MTPTRAALCAGLLLSCLSAPPARADGGFWDYTFHLDGHSYSFGPNGPGVPGGGAFDSWPDPGPISLYFRDQRGAQGSLFPGSGASAGCTGLFWLSAEEMDADGRHVEHAWWEALSESPTAPDVIYDLTATATASLSGAGYASTLLTAPDAGTQVLPAGGYTVSEDGSLAWTVSAVWDTPRTWHWHYETEHAPAAATASVDAVPDGECGTAWGAVTAKVQVQLMLWNAPNVPVRPPPPPDVTPPGGGYPGGGGGYPGGGGGYPGGGTPQ